MNYYDFINKEMMADNSEINFNPNKNAILLFNLLFYSVNFKNAYNYFYDGRYEFEFDEINESLKGFVDLFNYMKKDKISYKDYIRVLIQNVFNIDINTKNYKVFNEQVKEIFNRTKNITDLYLTTYEYAPYGKANMFIFALVNGLSQLIRYDNKEKEDRRKFQIRVIELYYLKFDFTLDHTPSDEELNFYIRNVIHHLHLLSKYLLTETNYNNEQIKNVIQFCNNFFAKSEYFEYKINEYLYDYYNLYFQSVLLLSLNFDILDTFYMITNIYALTPKFINVFEDLFPSERIDKFRNSNLKYLRRTSYNDVKDIINIDKLEFEIYKDYYSDKLLRIMDKKINNLYNRYANIHNDFIDKYLNSDQFNLFDNNDFLLSTINQLINVTYDKINIFKDFQNMRNNFDKNDEHLFEYYAIMTVLKLDITRKLRETFQYDFLKPIDQVIGKLAPDIIDLVIFGDLNEKSDNYEEEVSKLKEIIKLGTLSEKKLKFYDEDLSKVPIETDENCPDCGSVLVVRRGVNGLFYGCSKFPKCVYSKDFENREYLEKNVYEKNKAMRVFNKLENFVNKEDDNKLINEENKLKIITSFNYNDTKKDIINYLYNDIAVSSFYSNLKQLTKLNIEYNIKKLKTNDLYDWTYTLGLSKYLLDYYEINQETLFIDESPIDWTFIYVLLTKSLENLIANFIEYKINATKNKRVIMIRKYNHFISLNIDNEKWREGLTINDLKYIIERYLKDKSGKASELPDKIKVLLQDDRNKYLHHNSLKGFYNLKNTYFVKIFELLYSVITEV